MDSRVGLNEAIVIVGKTKSKDDVSPIACSNCGEKVSEAPGTNMHIHIERLDGRGCRAKFVAYFNGQDEVWYIKSVRNRRLSHAAVMRHMEACKAARAAFNEVMSQPIPGEDELKPESNFAAELLKASS